MPALTRMLRAHPALSPGIWLEASREMLGGHIPSSTPERHLESALDWLCAAQDATGTGGIARGYSLTWNSYFRARGWQPAYPETTGYIIPTLFGAARRLQRFELRERALRAARWEIGVQLPSGAVRGGVMGEPESPAVFNTGQVLLGWLAAFEETGDEGFAAAARRAATFLAKTQDADGHWRLGNSQFALGGALAYNTRTAWALAEAGKAFGDRVFTDAAARNLTAAVRSQSANGWFPNCCLSDPSRPLLHTLAYTVRGLLEGGRVLGDASFIRAAERASAPLAASVSKKGWMPGRYWPDWRPAARWSCLTGQAQAANTWMRLAQLTGEARWLEPVPAVMRFLKRTQNCASTNAGVRGGIRGAWPMRGEYGRYEVLSWATKFFADALMRHEVAQGSPGAVPLSMLA